ncbi:MAG: HAD family hydrolase [Bacteroidia bacterium]|nr:HAD family hydrolase [Bacteroidia bacterium]
MQTQPLAAFDFDGTLVRGDSMWAFFRFVWGVPRLGLRLVRIIPALIAFKAGWITRQQAKAQIIRTFVGGMPVTVLAAHAAAFTDTWVSTRLRSAGLKKIRWHQAQGHRVVLVTASLDIWTRPWADQLGIGLIATAAEAVDGYYTGHIGPNCYGAQKVVRLEQAGWLTPDTPCWAYGDSAGDRELLARATHAFFKPFHHPPHLSDESTDA